MEMQTTLESVLNFRKMRNDFPPQVLREGKALYDKGACLGAKVLSCTSKQIIVEAKVMGKFDDLHESSLEIERNTSQLVYATCDCSNNVDCSHLACLLFYLEEHFHSMLLSFLGTIKHKGDGKKAREESGLDEIERKVHAKVKREKEKRLVTDYHKTGEWLACSSLFRLPEEKIETGELMILVGSINGFNTRFTEIQLAVRLTGRPKPVLIQNPRAFLQALLHLDPLMLGSQRAVLDDSSFGEKYTHLVDFLRREFEYHDRPDKLGKVAFLDLSALSSLLSTVATKIFSKEEGRVTLFLETFDKSLQFSQEGVRPSFELDIVEDPDTRLIVKTFFNLPSGKIALQEVRLLLASPPGLLHEGTYYPIAEPFCLRHAVDLEVLDHHAIPEPLFSSFLTYGLPSLQRFGQVKLPKIFEEVRKATTLENPVVVCSAELSKGELSVQLRFRYGSHDLPEVKRTHTMDEIDSLSEGKILIPRNFMKELLLTQELAWGLLPDEKEGSYTTKSEKRIIEFVSETKESMGKDVEWRFSDMMSRCFIFEDSKIVLTISEANVPGLVRCCLSVDGPMEGLDAVKITEAARMRRSYIETGECEPGIFSKKIIILSQDEVEALSLIVEDFSITSFKSGEWMIPLWTIVGLDDGPTMSRQVSLSCSSSIKQLQQSLLDPKVGGEVVVSAHLKKQLHPYQKEGVQWLKRLRNFGLGGILADDMGLGKTIQAICALSEVHKGRKASPSLIVCPTSLVDNWKEELTRFEPNLKVITYVGIPGDRRKIFSKMDAFDVIVTSYGLIQRDLDLFEPLPFSYVILDEAQAIKNRETQNARSVKKLKAGHRLVLTGTPIENSVDDLWSLFDFLMPGFLGSHDRFVQSYVRTQSKEPSGSVDVLKKRISSFVLRRMKQDVLEDLPPISHLVYHCNLRNEQYDLYQATALRAKEELTELVERNGFEKTRLHVLATLTRLKQICCHPSLVLKDKDKNYPSAKYEMLQDLLNVLVGGGHKTVLFSQYTSMLEIIRKDLLEQGIKHLYLDGSTKNRLGVVKQFNEDGTIPLFLVSLRAGGNGLNLVGADSVIHYDMWWNPAVENQATDRVWRMGQKTKVSSYKLITKNTIEERIVLLQEKKKNLISDLVSSLDDVLTKLTWEDVLGLLKT